MTPEEFYWRNKLSNEDNLKEMRVRSLGWMLDCFNRGTIRKRTIKNLIPRIQLEYLMMELEEDEKYEDCAVIRDILKEIYDTK